MKKRIYVLLAVFCFALAFTACSKDDDDNGPAFTPDGKRLISKIICVDYTVSFNYDGDGRVIKVTEDFDGDLDIYMYTYSDGKITITNTYTDYDDNDKEIEVSDKIYCTLNNEGYVTKTTTEYEGAYKYDYNQEGYCTAYYFEGRLGRSYTYEKGNVVNGGNSSLEVYTYTDIVNKANLDLLHLFAQTYSEDTYYLAMIGRIGKPTKNLLSSMERYENKFHHKLEYEFDKDGYVVKIIDNKEAYQIEYK